MTLPLPTAMQGMVRFCSLQWREGGQGWVVGVAVGLMHS